MCRSQRNFSALHDKHRNYGNKRTAAGCQQSTACCWQYGNHIRARALSTVLFKILSNDNRSDHDQPLLQNVLAIRLLACGNVLRRVFHIKHYINRLILDYPGLSQQFTPYEQKQWFEYLPIFEKNKYFYLSLHGFNILTKTLSSVIKCEPLARK
jgi:hypothetical protein